MKNRTIPIVLSMFLIIIIAASGCTDLSDDDDEEESTFEGKGLGLSFNTGVPDDNIYVNDAFEIEVAVENEGGYTIPANKVAVFLHGINFNVYNAAGENYDDALNWMYEIITTPIGAAGLGGSDIPGDTITANFGTPLNKLNRSSIGIGAGKQGHDEFVATACYAYQTSDTAKVCLGKTAIAGGEKDCTPGNITESLSSVGAGSPIRVTNVVASGTSSGFTFKLDIENKGNGDAFLFDKDPTTPKDWGQCLTLLPSQANRISVTNLTIDGAPICVDSIGQGKVIRLNNEGKGILTCSEQGYRNISPYPAGLIITLDYHYKTRTAKKVTINNV